MTQAQWFVSPNHVECTMIVGFSAHRYPPEIRRMRFVGRDVRYSVEKCREFMICLQLIVKRVDDHLNIFTTDFVAQRFKFAGGGDASRHFCILPVAEN
ncbi:hypothetical protein EDC63_105105 [Sulfurirhabdus autotrophica]|uniref:Uncharacterized protein n=1 Tax=Sulfurirhabdus autotrophica TaxID=1706046 RepID=A0A4R3Y6I4_9PROT|nr:hypothetical protein EDC63_105105 [Sulfurirhabdus autotrophica]